MIGSKIRKIFGIEQEEGAGAKVRRLFPTRSLPYIDPFVLLDEFFLSPSAGFPSHTHRGFEAITYMLEGSFRHQDNLGHHTEVFPGGVQHFSAGKGLVHSEMPGNQPLNHGLQLWVNLPKSLKGIEPTYQQVGPHEIPETNLNGVKIRTLVSNGSPVKLYTPIRYQVIETVGTSTVLSIPPGYSGFLYVYRGQLEADKSSINPGEGLRLNGGEKLPVQSQGPTGFILVSGLPHRESINLHGLFVD